MRKLKRKLNELFVMLKWLWVTREFYKGQRVTQFKMCWFSFKHPTRIS